MKLIFSFVYVSLILVKVICEEENSCDVLKTGSCVDTIHVSITSDLKTFTVYYSSSITNNEITAVCDLTGQFILCETKTGINYKAVSRTQVSFKPMSGVSCLDGNFTLHANGHGNFACIETSEKSRSESTDDAKKHRGGKDDTVKGHHKPPQEDTPGTTVNFLDFGYLVPVIDIVIGLLIVVCSIGVLFFKTRQA